MLPSMFHLTKDKEKCNNGKLSVFMYDVIYDIALRRVAVERKVKRGYKM
jgi:hypothetical protein